MKNCHFKLTAEFTADENDVIGVKEALNEVLERMGFENMTVVKVENESKI